MFNRFKTKYGEHIHLVYTGTDSLTLEIKTYYVYDDIKNDPELDQLINRNTGKLGSWKDENIGDPITEYIALKRKTYANKTVNSTKTKASGIDKDAMSDQVKWESYMKAIKGEELPKIVMKRQLPRDHVIEKVTAKRNL